MRDKAKRIPMMIMAFAVMMLMGCSFFQKQLGNENPENKEDTGFLLTGPGSYDSADTSIITGINTEEGTITFLNTVVSKKYTLHYDGTTTITDKYDQPLSLEQIQEGDIVDITFLKSKKKLNTLCLSRAGWSNEEVVRYTIDTTNRNVTIGNEIYKITKDTLIFSDREEVDLMDINPSDILNFQGIDSTIYSIVISKGHGYLRLSGDENFIGGWIEVGQNIIHQITDDMLLTVPEGSYQVQVSTTGGGGTKNVIINRNEEAVLDISDFKIAKPQYGQVIFTLTPANTKLYVDGEPVDTSGPVKLQYGIHQLIAKAEGYSSVTSYLKVFEETAGIAITLDPITKEEEKGEEEKPTVSSGDGNQTASYYKVYVDAPEGAEVYLDGNYVGICPVSFKKTAGAHVITLRKTGYETRSFTIQVDSEDKDISYSFADLIMNQLQTTDIFQ